jgi:hypothetical protein
MKQKTTKKVLVFDLPLLIGLHKICCATNGSAQQTSCDVSLHLLRTRQNIGQAPLAFERSDMCDIKVFNQSINQSMFYLILQNHILFCKHNRKEDRNF